MRVLFGETRFPFCFCKPSSHLYTPSSSLKLENTPHASPSQPLEISSLGEGQILDAQSSSNVNGSCNGNGNHPSSENGLKSSLRKTSPDSSLVEKKKVQWVDVCGKQLAEIKEFVSSEDDDSSYQCLNNRRCVCTIL